MQTFEEMWSEHERYLRVYAFKLTRNAQSTNDLVQDTAVKAFKAFEKFDGLKPKHWLSVIMRNQFYTNCRKEKCRPVVSDYSYENNDVVSVTGSAEQQFVDSFVNEDLVKAFKKMPSEFQQVFGLYAIGQYDMRQISEMLNVPMGTVASRISRARKALKKSLEMMEVY